TARLEARRPLRLPPRHPPPPRRIPPDAARTGRVARTAQGAGARDPDQGRDRRAGQPGSRHARRPRPCRGAGRPDARSLVMAHRTKFIFVTGGVVSSLGKGIAAASIGALMEARGLTITMLKFDPYINVDAGTMNPFQHG